MEETIGRNDPCHCGSGKKYKKCHLDQDSVKERKGREKSLVEAEKKLAAELEKAQKESKDGKVPEQHQHVKHADEGKQSWFSKIAGKAGFMGKQQRRAPPMNKGG